MNRTLTISWLLSIFGVSVPHDPQFAKGIARCLELSTRTVGKLRGEQPIDQSAQTAQFFRFLSSLIMPPAIACASCLGTVECMMLERDVNFSTFGTSVRQVAETAQMHAPFTRHAREPQAAQSPRNKCSAFRDSVFVLTLIFLASAAPPPDSTDRITLGVFNHVRHLHHALRALPLRYVHTFSQFSRRVLILFDLSGSLALRCL